MTLKRLPELVELEEKELRDAENEEEEDDDDDEKVIELEDFKEEIDGSQFPATPQITPRSQSNE